MTISPKLDEAIKNAAKAAVDSSDFDTAKALLDLLEKPVAVSTSPKPRPSSPLRKRTTREQREEALASIVGLLEAHPKGLRAETIRSELALEKSLFQQAIALGKESDQVQSQGQRRATVYLLPSRGAIAMAEGRVRKRRKP